MKALLFALMVTSSIISNSALAESPGLLYCTFKVANGRYLTAVGGGGKISDVIHTDAIQAGAWEKFRMDKAPDGSATRYVYIETYNRNYLTAVDGGGRITDVIHSDATHVSTWERFEIVNVINDTFAIRTVNGRYLTAVGGGGRITDAIHSDATRIGAWEKFRMTCGVP